MRYQSQSTVSKSFQWAIVFFSVESFITTTCGVASLGSALAHDPVTVGVCWAVAVLVAGALAISMAGLAHRLYRRVTFPPLIALIILASCAILFDAAFFNELYMVTLQGQTGDLHDKEYRQKEYERLVQEVFSTVTKIREHVALAILRAAQDEHGAQEGIRYETELRVPINMRRCGPVCEQHKREEKDYRAAREHAESLREVLNKIPSTPASAETWNDLTQFHTTIVGLLGQIPLNGIQVKIPAAPMKPSGLTQGGNAESAGGLGYVTELLEKREFHRPQIALPLILGAMCEYIVIVLVLGLHPWRPVRIWSAEKLENTEQTIQTMPALWPLLCLIFTRGFLRDDDVLRQKRHARNKRWHEQQEELRTMKELQELELELSS